MDGEGRPILTASTLALHTQDLLADGRCTLTVTSHNFRRGAGLLLPALLLQPPAAALVQAGAAPWPRSLAAAPSLSPAPARACSAEASRTGASR